MKQDQEITDPVQAVMPPSINPETSLMKIFSLTGHRASTSSTTATPGHTPPGTPNTVPTGSTSATTGTGTSLISPAQGGLASSLGTASLASSGLIKPSKTKKKKTKVYSKFVICFLNHF